ncbi:N-formylglutamate amidohydrolase [Noviherbaspirillum cavernae]|uniref:N-formylglutamate amidohydrolase n=1 Tax=Noviherbaspirillum cavernae TaxID=2320862 RepID=A0A418X6F2_9BURK|nr:N-formylglutamate amidohydrolase [Noviherbaspirillum cavernae]
MASNFLITCEHGGNRIPSPYRKFFRGHQALLRTHRGRDFGALRLARELSDALDAPLLLSTVSRLLIDLNRSPGHRGLHAEAMRDAPRAIREEVYRQYYLPYRTEVQNRITQTIGSGARIVHLSCHSFTPELDGKLRNADIGLLYDPARTAEAHLCRRWQATLKTHAPELKTRMNYPYKGTSDGLTAYLRKCFAPQDYLGIELEINQKHVLARGPHWSEVRSAVIAALLELVRPER